MNKAVLFPGMFDPPSIGHLDLIERASKMFSKVYVGIAVNPAKAETLFTPSERKEMLEVIAEPFSNVEVVVFDGLVIDFAKKQGVGCLVRGIRAFSDLEHEFGMALANRAMSGIETVFLMADAKLAHISSTLIREIGSFGHRLHGFVPDRIEEQVFKRISGARGVAGE